jgi:hypothetical protein
MLTFGLLCLVALSMAGPLDPMATTSLYPGNLPATCETTGTISLSGAFLAQDSVCVLNAAGRCCAWNPLLSGKGAALASTTVVLHMQTTDDLVTTNTDTLVDITVSLSGGDLAVRACLPAFSFTLLAGTADANGLTGLGGYLWSDGTVFLPPAYAPASSNYTALPLSFTPQPNRPKIYANFFTDGSVRLTGPQGVAIPAGTYNIKAACIVYNARKNAKAAPPNVLISDANCTSTIAPITTRQQNAQTLFGNYYEYFALDYYNGVGYIVGIENCYPGSNNGSVFFNRSMLASFYKVQRSGAGLTRLSYIPTLDATLTDDSVDALIFAFRTQPNRIGVVNTNQQEPGIAVSRLTPGKMALVMATFQNPISFGGWQMGFSLDAGVTWDLNSVNLPNDVGIPGSFMFPYPQVFKNTSWNCSHFSGSWNCPPLDTDTNFTTGTELTACNSLYPNSRGDNAMTVDALDVFWQVGLYSHGEAPNDVANNVVSYSLDYGATWLLAGDIAMANGTAFSYDYDVVAGGSDGRGGAQFCAAIKVDRDVNEFIAFGTLAPIELNCFHTTTRGIVDSIARVAMPGTEPGHYGGMNIGKDGTIYLVLHGMQPVVTDPNAFVIGTGAGPFGSNILANAPILFTTCTPSPNVVCQQAKVIARADLGFYCPNPQPFRCTWSHPQIQVDKNNNLYVLWYDVVRNPLPTQDAFFSFVNAEQETRILMIKSCDGGNTWSAPQAIHDDSTTSDSYSTPNIHFNLVSRYDPITNTILASWMDTRVDPDTQTGTQVYAAVITL